MASKKGSYIATGDNATERRRSLSVPVLPANFSKVAPSKEFEAEEIRERERGWEGFEERIHSADSREYIVRSSEGTCGVMDFLVSLLLAFLIRLYFLSSTTSDNVFYRYDYITAVICLIWLWSKLTVVREEHVLLLRGMGLQIKTVYLFGRTSARFIPISLLEQVIINEGITMFTVRFYFAAILKGHDKMVVIFPNLLPRLKVVERVYRGAQATLSDRQTVHTTHD